MPQKIELGVEPYEVVLGVPRLTVRSPSPLDPETARGALALANGIRGSVALSRDGRTATFVPDEPLEPGAHTLTVGELVTKRGKRIVDNMVIPFVVADSNAKARSNVRVQSMVRLRVDGGATERLALDEPASGKYVEVMKVIDRKTGKPMELAFDERGNRVDHEQLFTKLENSRRRKYGKLHPTLYAQLERGGNRRVPVAIWVAVDDEPRPDKREKGESKRRLPAERAHAKHIAEMAGIVSELARLRRRGGRDRRCRAGGVRTADAGRDSETSAAQRGRRALPARDGRRSRSEGLDGDRTVRQGAVQSQLHRHGRQRRGL
jgi:hypothetical protein